MNLQVWVNSKLESESFLHVSQGLVVKTGVETSLALLSVSIPFVFLFSIILLFTKINPPVVALAAPIIGFAAIAFRESTNCLLGKVPEAEENEN